MTLRAAKKNRGAESLLNPAQAKHALCADKNSCQSGMIGPLEPKGGGARLLVLHSVNTVTDSLAVTPAKAGVQCSREDLDSRFYRKLSAAGFHCRCDRSRT
jgi:hypothetical protein